MQRLLLVMMLFYGVLVCPSSGAGDATSKTAWKPFGDITSELSAKSKLLASFKDKDTLFYVYENVPRAHKTKWGSIDSGMSQDVLTNDLLRFVRVVLSHRKVVYVVREQGGKKETVWLGFMHESCKVESMYSKAEKAVLLVIAAGRSSRSIPGTFIYVCRTDKQKDKPLPHPLAGQKVVNLLEYDLSVDSAPVSAYYFWQTEYPDKAPNRVDNISCTFIDDSRAVRILGNTGVKGQVGFSLTYDLERNAFIGNAEYVDDSGKVIPPEVKRQFFRDRLKRKAAQVKADKLKAKEASE